MVPQKGASRDASTTPPLHRRTLEVGDSNFSTLIEWSSSCIEVLFDRLYPRVRVLSLEFRNVHFGRLDKRLKAPVSVCAPCVAAFILFVVRVWGV
jgi:hypothetical protein